MNTAKILWGDEELGAKAANLDYVLLRVHKSPNGYCGYLKMADNDTVHSFRSLDEILLLLAYLHPAKDYRLRTLGTTLVRNADRPEVECGRKACVFTIQPIRWEEFSIQGKLICHSLNRKVFFRSALELLFLMHSALAR